MSKYKLQLNIYYSDEIEAEDEEWAKAIFMRRYFNADAIEFRNNVSDSLQNLIEIEEVKE